MKRTATPTLATLLCLLVSSTAMAHPGHDMPASGLLAGMTHPLLGLDHLLAMVAVGLLSAQRGGMSLWALPGMFLASMVAGGTAGLWGTRLPAVELGIALSIVILGVALTLHRKARLTVPLVLVGMFGCLHGIAHGSEMPAATQPALYAAGFVAATFVLHASGIVLARVALRYSRGMAGLRFSGAALVIVGLFFAINR